MTAHPHVPADDEAGSILDLVEDCREVSGVLARFAPGEVRRPDAHGSPPLEIGADVAARLEGWNDYGC